MNKRYDLVVIFAYISFLLFITLAVLYFMPNIIKEEVNMKRFRVTQYLGGYMFNEWTVKGNIVEKGNVFKFTTVSGNYIEATGTLVVERIKNE